VSERGILLTGVGRFAAAGSATFLKDPSPNPSGEQIDSLHLPGWNAPRLQARGGLMNRFRESPPLSLVSRLRFLL